ncbi:MAG TPA: NAD-dependent succinate-semialdehyde dehydrogenase [Kofleriaceae bacterium]|nr:NAD-dependent succinate-semialdehyde dehydrogenase [Kofleriaceae bacterium]
MIRYVDAYIDGAWVGGDARFDVVDPATGAVLARVPDLADAEVERAIAAADRAWAGWRATPAPERASKVAAIAAALRADEQALGALITAENGKPRAEAVAEVRYAASFFEWFAGEAVRITGELIPAARADQRIIVTREPVGPCAMITPWNFPAAMLARKLAAALAAGCTVVAKPAEQTPLTALAMAAIAAGAGVPPGVVNIVTGDARRVGGRLLDDPRLRKISFTGSTEVGRLVLGAAARRIARVSCELGGNAPFIVLDDADVERAVDGAMVAKFRGGGQTCVAANRFLVARPLAEAFTAAITARASRLVVGPGHRPGVTQGPLIDDDAVAKMQRLCADAVARGARLRLGAVPDGTTRLVAPVVLTGITDAMALWREEIFAPVIAIATFDGDDQAVAMANDTEAGLVAYVYGGSLERAARVAARLDTGMVGINEGLVSTAQAPFGGVKASGYGREGSHWGLDDYLSLKYTMMALTPERRA